MKHPMEQHILRDFDHAHFQTNFPHIDVAARKIFCLEL